MSCPLDVNHQGLTFGFDTGVIGGVIAMDDFRDEFGYPRKIPEQDDEVTIIDTWA